MSALDETLDRCAEDWPTTLDKGARELLSAARAELAALRQRAEDAELMLRAVVVKDFHMAEVHGGDRDGSVSFYDWSEQEEINEARFLAAPRCARREDGIPILTPAAREALRKALG